MLTEQGSDCYVSILANLQHSRGLWLLPKFHFHSVSLLVKEIALHLKTVPMCFMGEGGGVGGGVLLSTAY